MLVPATSFALISSARRARSNSFGRFGWSDRQLPGGSIEDLAVSIYGDPEESVRTVRSPILGWRRRQARRLEDAIPPRRRGRPLRGLDPLKVAAGLLERGMSFDRFLAAGEASQLEAFLTDADDEELAAPWGVKESAVRKRRERLRTKLESVTNRLIVRGENVNAEAPPTIREEVTDINTRLMEVERQIGVPVGGDRAADQSVEDLIADVHTDDEGT